MVRSGKFLAALCVCLAILCGTSAAGGKPEWKLAIQTWSFHTFTFYEAIDRTASVGAGYIEAMVGQKLSKEKGDVVFGPDLTAEQRQEVRQKLEQAKVKVVGYGVAGLANDEAACRKIFDFAKDMGIGVIGVEPPAEAFPLIDRLCQEYKIKIAIHNHPKPSGYWDPNTVLAACQGRSEWIGACADTGHWMRSGIKPVDAIRKLKGRIASVHLKDLNEFGVREAHDVPWGTGKADVNAVLTELNNQGFKGLFSIEYEWNWDNSLPEIRQCVEYFNSYKAKAASQKPQRCGKHSTGDGQ